MSKTFRCKRSGNTVTFHLEGDIAGLLKHEGYEEVKDAEATKAVQTESPEAPSKEVLKIRRKSAPIPEFLGG